jgi:hypothetical protein
MPGGMSNRAEHTHFFAQHLPTLAELQVKAPECSRIACATGMASKWEQDVRGREVARALKERSSVAYSAIIEKLSLLW